MNDTLKFFTALVMIKTLGDLRQMVGKATHPLIKGRKLSSDSQHHQDNSKATPLNDQTVYTDALIFCLLYTTMLNGQVYRWIYQGRGNRSWTWPVEMLADKAWHWIKVYETIALYAYPGWNFIVDGHTLWTRRVKFASPFQSPIV
jgi:hypothetical protein